MSRERELLHTGTGGVGDVLAKVAARVIVFRPRCFTRRRPAIPYPIEVVEHVCSQFNSVIDKNQYDEDRTNKTKQQYNNCCAREITKIANLIQLNPAIAYFKGLVKIMLYTKLLSIANEYITMNTQNNINNHTNHNCTAILL